MKVLYLLRHAEAGRGDPGLADFDRPLNERGRAAAALVGGFMREKGIRPAAVVSSPAARARQTAESVSEAAGLGTLISFDGRVYEAHPLDLLKIVGGRDESAAELLLVGHNPGLEELLGRLTGERERLATAALARIELRVQRWAQVSDGVGRLDWVVTPGGLEGG